MGFVDPVSAFIRWGTFTVPATITTLTITHSAAFIPDRVILFPKDVYAWAGQAVASNYTGLTFDITLISAQAGDAQYEYVVGKN